MLRMPVASARKCIGPCGQVGFACRPFIRVGPCHFVYRTEVVIQFDVDLLSSRACSAKSKNAFVATTDGADPSVTGGVQSVADFVIVGRRHFPQYLRDKTG